MKRIYSLHFPNFLLTIITRVFNDYVLVGLIRVGLVYSTVQIVVGHYLKHATTWSNCSVGSGLWWGGWTYLATVLWCYSNINNRFVHDQFPRYRHRNPGCQGLAAVSRLFRTLLIAVPSSVRPAVATLDIFCGKKLLNHSEEIYNSKYSSRDRKTVARDTFLLEFWNRG